MTNAIDYIKWRGDLSFDATPINEADLFIFSQLATPDYKGIVSDNDNCTSLTDAAVKYFRTHTDSVENLGLLQSDSVLPMFKLLGGCTRFSDVRFSKYRNRISNDRNLQFSAISFRIDNVGTVIAFRGTDDTIVGWKEDFYLAIKEEVPAQLEALKYLREVAENTDGDIYIVGHSKGGNLAVFSAVKACSDPEMQKRIKRVISFDGPGFMQPFFNTDEYNAIKDRISTITSKNGLVAMIMDYAGELIIANTQTTGPMAHDGFKWEVLGTRFVRTAEMSDRSIAFHSAIKDLFEKVAPEEAEKAFESMFEILMSRGADTVTELKEQKALDLTEILKGLGTNKEVSEFNIQLMRNLVKSYVDVELEELRNRINGLGEKINDLGEKTTGRTQK